MVSVDSRPRLTQRVERHYRAILAYGSPSCDPLRRQLHAHGVAWAALGFARRWRSRRIDVSALQRVVIVGANAAAALEFALQVPGAQAKKLQVVLVLNGTPDQLRQFATEAHGCDRAFLEGLADVKEIMSV